MEPVQLASGDSAAGLPSSNIRDEPQEKHDEVSNHEAEDFDTIDKIEISNKDQVTTEVIINNEIKLKERIDECRNIIESLKLELSEEKEKSANRTKYLDKANEAPSVSCTTQQYGLSRSLDFENEILRGGNMYSASVEKKLNYDEGLIQYERQLEKYQNTLNLAQIEKKNAIRKQMLAKAFKLKLMEVENQCNIELLRVKQSLQCLEPLKLIASKWKDNSDSNYDLDMFEPLPRYPELSCTPGCDLKPLKEELEAQVTNEKSSECEKHDFVITQL